MQPGRYLLRNLIYCEIEMPKGTEKIFTQYILTKDGIRFT
jgi:hypothetical protein